MHKHMELLGIAAGGTGATTASVTLSQSWFGIPVL